MNACITSGWISLIWRMLGMVFYGEAQLRIIDDVMWLILFRYIYLDKLRKVRLYEIAEKLFMKSAERRWAQDEDE